MNNYFMRIFMIILGFILTLTIVFSIIGMPMILAGFNDTNITDEMARIW